MVGGVCLEGVQWLPMVIGRGLYSVLCTHT